MSVTIRNLYQQLTQMSGLKVHRDEPMARHTSFGIGGPADILLIPQDTASLVEVVQTLSAADSKPLYIGNGTNLLIRDGGIRGVVVKIAGALTGIEHDGNELISGAGESLAAICHYAAHQGLSGLEFAAGIPGSVGGGIVMNAGANGGEIAQVLAWVEAINAGHEVNRYQRSDLDFGYRCSQFQAGKWVITRAALALTPAVPSQVRQSMYEAVEKRCQRQPVSDRSAGCIFKHPPSDYAGRLLEETDTKGMRVGGAMISPKHANFIINTGQATAADVLALINQVRDKVEAEFGVKLATEICICGEDT